MKDNVKLALKKLILRLFSPQSSQGKTDGRNCLDLEKLSLLSNWAGLEIKHQRFTKKFLMKETERVIEKFH